MPNRTMAFPFTNAYAANKTYAMLILISLLLLPWLPRMDSNVWAMRLQGVNFWY